MSLDLSLIICCYNEEEILQENVRRLVGYLDRLRLSWELIFVDDCSRDRTRELIRALAEEFRDRPLKTIFHERNTGRGGAVKTGLRAARGTVAGFIDIDLEVPEWYILPCVQAILDGRAEIVTGLRTYKIRLSPYILSRHFLSMGYRLVVRRLVGTNLRDTETGYKFFRRETILPLLDRTVSNHWFWDTEVMLLAELQRLRIIELLCLFVRNPEKTSTVKVFRDSLRYLRELRQFKRRLATTPEAIDERTGLFTSPDL